jgi:hypothetical protein
VRVMKQGVIVAAFVLGASSSFAGCPTADEICNPDEAENTCSGNGDCALGYCATECCYCPRPYSLTQLDDTWCLTLSGTTQPIVDCMTGRTERCRGVVCVCDYQVEAWCNAGKCDLRSTTP